MPSDAMIEVTGLGKRYRLGQIHHDRLADALAHGLTRLGAGLRRAVALGAAPARRSAAGPAEDHIWALRDVSFSVARGEVLGIIGRNGAGKSTALKILTGITEPTEGRAVLRGRVASLLEVGTGFHPELTGRENVFLNGAILGMSRAEIRRKFDEIVAFAEVEPFVDTPVKRYSSGMYLRLAFAVAAHLEPDILLVDEVLAVGDAGFQRKCLGKMKAVSGEGRTVLFVSHNMGAVGGLCGRVVLLDGGRVRCAGDAHEVIGVYLRPAGAEEAGDAVVPDAAGAGYTLAVSRTSDLHVRCGDAVTLVFEVASPRPVSGATAGLVLRNLNGETVAGMSSKCQGVCGEGAGSRWRFTCRLGRIPLNSGRYDATIYFGNAYRDEARFDNALVLHVERGDPFGCGNAVPPSWGCFYWTPEWEVRPAE